MQNAAYAQNRVTVPLIRGSQISRFSRLYTIWPHESWSAWQAFLCGLGAKNEEQESKTARSKPKIPFHGLFLLRNQTETLATQATRKFKE